MALGFGRFCWICGQRTESKTVLEWQNIFRNVPKTILGLRAGFVPLECSLMQTFGQVQKPMSEGRIGRKQGSKVVDGPNPESDLETRTVQEL